MKLQQRIQLLEELGKYLQSNDTKLQEIKNSAFLHNQWFVPAFLDLSIANIAQYFLSKDVIDNWLAPYSVPETINHPFTVGVTMAGNIPLVGFHDFLCIFISGHRQLIKLSSKDHILLRHLVEKMTEWEPLVKNYVNFAEILTGCDAYIATGSNNSSRYFEYYFAKYPHIIRRNRTSVAILTGNESDLDLAALSDDLLLYFGLGCRNISKIYVPPAYDFRPLLAAMHRYSWMRDHNKFRNNYDYQLSLLLLNNQYYMTNDLVLLVENPQIFSPISQIHYTYYDGASPNDMQALHPEQLQGITGNGHLAFGQSQCPQLHEYADGVDTMTFLTGLIA